MYLVVVVQLLSCVWLFVTPWAATHQASLSFTISWSLLKLMSIELVMASNHLMLCLPFLLMLSIFPSIRDFFNESVLIPGNVPGTCSKNLNHAGRYKMKNKSSFLLPPPPRSSQNLSSAFFKKIIYIHIMKYKYIYLKSIPKDIILYPLKLCFFIYKMS